MGQDPLRGARVLGVDRAGLGPCGPWGGGRTGPPTQSANWNLQWGVRGEEKWLGCQLG